MSIATRRLCCAIGVWAILLATSWPNFALADVWGDAAKRVRGGAQQAGDALRKGGEQARHQLEAQQRRAEQLRHEAEQKASAAKQAVERQQQQAREAAHQAQLRAAELQRQAEQQRQKVAEAARQAQQKANETKRLAEQQRVKAEEQAQAAKRQAESLRQTTHQAALQSQVEAKKQMEKGQRSLRDPAERAPHSVVNTIHGDGRPERDVPHSGVMHHGQLTKKLPTNPIVDPNRPVTSLCPHCGKSIPVKEWARHVAGHATKPTAPAVRVCPRCLSQVPVSQLAGHLALHGASDVGNEKLRDRLGVGSIKIPLGNIGEFNFKIITTEQGRFACRGELSIKGITVVSSDYDWSISDDEKSLIFFREVKGASGPRMKSRIELTPRGQRLHWSHDFTAHNTAGGPAEHRIDSGTVMAPFVFPPVKLFKYHVTPPSPNQPLSAYLIEGLHPAKAFTLSAEFGGGYLYHVNGMNTPKLGNVLRSQFEAREEATALSIRLGRTVRLLHNPTAGQGEDLVQCTEDRSWKFPMPQRNGTTKMVAGMLLYHAKRNEHVSVVGHSQGNIIIRNALQTLVALGYKPWVESRVRWVATGNPLRDTEIALAGARVHVTSLNNPRDPINFVGRNEQIRVTGVDSKTGVNRVHHNFVRSYVHQIQAEMLWPERGVAPGTMPQGLARDVATNDATQTQANAQEAYRIYLSYVFPR